jgi:ATP-dependent DNA ligase
MGKRFLDAACGAKAEGIISKRIDCPYKPGNRGLWVKTKCINEEEFVIVGYSEPEGSRPHLGALLLAYYDDERRLIYAGRAGTGMSQAELKRVYDKLQPLRISEMPLDKPPPRSTRFGSPLVLSRVKWVKPKLVAQVRFLTWTATVSCDRCPIKVSGRTSPRKRCGESGNGERARSPQSLISQ